MPEAQLEWMIQRSGIEDHDFTINDALMIMLPQSLEASLDLAKENVRDLNSMYTAIVRLSPEGQKKLDAAACMAAPSDSRQIRCLVENLDLFDFMPDVHTPEEYGRHLIQQSGRFDYDSELDAFYDYGKYGQQSILQEHGIFTEQGYIAYHGTLPLDELMQGDSIEQTEGLEMGGLC